eukprot:jgi/Botrbrau1/22113/Bobra.0206s0039.1
MPIRLQYKSLVLQATRRIKNIGETIFASENEPCSDNWVRSSFHHCLGNIESVPVLVKAQGGI